MRIRLFGRITDEMYHKFQVLLQERLSRATTLLCSIQDAEENYYLTMQGLFDLASQGYDLFVGSKIEDRRHLINLVLLNLRIDDEKMLWDVKEPFKMLLDFADRQDWCAR
jgi:hypothetical protein